MSGPTRQIAKRCGDVLFKNETSMQKWWRDVSWKMWDGKQYGMMWHDGFFYPHPTVREAVRRLGIKEPWEYDARQQRIMKAHNLVMRNEILPKDQWTKFEQESWYLQDYINEIEQEQSQRSATSFLKGKHFEIDEIIKNGGHYPEPQP